MSEEADKLGMGERVSPSDERNHQPESGEEGG